MMNDKLIGLVACGGKSSRMGKEKFLLHYHGIPQYEQVYRLLVEPCEEVYISCNAAQQHLISTEFPCIVDLPNYSDIGPMAALWAAHQKFPTASFLLLGCDYPLLKQGDIQKLVEARKEECEAICYYHPESKMEEPLLALYENRAFQQLKKNLQNQNYSLRHLLKEIKTHLIPANKHSNLISVDSPEQIESLAELKKLLKGN